MPRAAGVPDDWSRLQNRKGKPLIEAWNLTKRRQTTAVSDLTFTVKAGGQLPRPAIEPEPIAPGRSKPLELKEVACRNDAS
jgi:hypothetical protein